MPEARAQGTIEYLVIIAVIVVIGLVVVSLVTSTFTAPTEQITSASGQISAMTGPNPTSTIHPTLR